MKRDKTKFILFMVIVTDILFTCLSWGLTYYLRFEILPGGERGLLTFFAYLLIPIIIIKIYCFNKYELYQFTVMKSWYQDIFNVLRAEFMAFGAVVVLFYFFFPSKISRLGLLIFFVLEILINLVQKVIINNIIYNIRVKKRKQRLLLVGHGSRMMNYLKAIQENDDSPYVIVGWVDRDEESDTAIPQYQDIVKAVETIHPDRIIVSYPSTENNTLNSRLSICYDLLLPVIILPNISYSFLSNHLLDYNGIPTLYLNHFHHSLADRIIKRTIDIIGSIIGIILFSPIFLILPILIKLSSKGPVFYGQIRMTRDGEEFKMWKFRSMKVDAEVQSGAVWAEKDDPRKTRLGSFMRATSLDELPQFFNVLTGQMSLVGPRPERPELVSEFKGDIPGYMLRHKMKAGITGWAQINGWRGNTSLQKRIQYDLYYIKNWSVLLDVKIIFLTFVKGFINKNAY